MILWLKRLFCGHSMSPNLYRETKDKHRRTRVRHYHECKKCGKRRYVD